MEVNGIAHIQLTVKSVKRSIAFYEPFLKFLEMKPLIHTDEYFYCIGSRTGIAICEADEDHGDVDFAQRRVGLHHLEEHAIVHRAKRDFRFLCRCSCHDYFVSVLLHDFAG